MSSVSSGIDLRAYTQTVIDAIGPKATERVKTVFPILIRKLHEFLIEADITVEEWLDACALLNEAGRVSTDKRNEMILVTDVLGVESLVDTLAFLRSETSEARATHSAILGPFYRAGVPVQPFGTTIVRREETNAPYTHLYGTVHGADGEPLPGAIIDVWHDAPSGLYDSQDPSAPEHHCRGRFEADGRGRYDTICLKPTPYPIPYDHSAGKLLKLMDRHPMRPAHIHFKVQARGHKTLVTQVFDRTSEYLGDDSVFAVKDNLIVDFTPISQSRSGWTAPREYADRIQYELEYNITLQAGREDDVLLAGGSLGGEPGGEPQASDVANGTSAGR